MSDWRLRAGRCRSDRENKGACMLASSTEIIRMEGQDASEHGEVKWGHTRIQQMSQLPTFVFLLIPPSYDLILTSNGNLLESCARYIPSPPPSAGYQPESAYLPSGSLDLEEEMVMKSLSPDHQTSESPSRRFVCRLNEFVTKTT